MIASFVCVSCDLIQVNFGIVWANHVSESVRAHGLFRQFLYSSCESDLKTERVK